MNLRAWWRRSRRETEMADELRLHVEARAEDLRRSGLSADDALRQARVEFGSVERYKEECRASLGYRAFDELRGDVRYALRGMRRQPAFALAAIVILGLATGVNTAFFTLFNNYALKPMAIRGADRHFDLSPRNERGGGVEPWTRAEWRALENAAPIEGVYAGSTYLVRAVQPQQRAVTVSAVSANYFQLLGARAFRGRLLTEAEEHQPVAVLSHAGWLKLFDGRENALGNSLRVRMTSFTVIGVAHPAFTGTEPAVPDFWTPLEYRDALRDSLTAPGEEPRYSLSGLLRPDAGFAQAGEALTAIARALPRPAELKIGKVVLTPRSTMIAQDEDMAPVSVFLFALFLAVLLIACANLANLHLARASSRTAEIAMRLSLGASRARIVRQLVTESLLLAVAGSALGLAAASLGLSYLEQYLWSSVTNLGLTIVPAGVDGRVFAFSAWIACVAALAFGLLPALEATAEASRRGLTELTKVRRRRWRGVLIGAQAAASLVLLLFAGILSRNLLQSVSVGFDTEPVFAFGDDLPTPANVQRFAREPWVASVSASSRIPFMSRGAEADVTMGGLTRKSRFSYVDETFFDTLAVRPMAGRLFTRQEAAARSKTAVISAATARVLWPGSEPRSALGRTFTLDRVEDSRLKGEYQVVGILPDLVTGWVFQGVDQMAIYLPAALTGESPEDCLLIRIKGPVAQARASLLSLCLAEGLGCEPSSLRELQALQTFPVQAAAWIASALGGLALLLTAVGLHGVVRYLVVQREREIGVRIALGAGPSRIVRWIVGESSRAVVLGMAVGLLVSLGLSQVLASSTLELKAFDLVAYLTVPLLLLLTALAASAAPAWRASRLDAMKALRQE